MLFPIVCVALAYLLGSVPFGYLVARARGVDILKLGSGNIGATNVGRTLGRKFGVLVFALDFLKGAMPTAITEAVTGDANWAVAAGLAAVIGHMFPIFLRLRGGKGVATGFGVVAVLMPAATSIAFLVWLSILSSTRFMSAASVIGAIVLASARLLTTPAPFSAAERIVTVFALVIALLVAVRHRANLGRLLQGNERQVSESRRLQMLTRVLHVVALGLWFGGGIVFSFLVTPSLFRTFESSQAGAAVAPMFPLYFALQAACGLIALATAAGWVKLGGVHRWRFVVLLLATLIVVAGWPLVGHVAELRAARNSPDTAIAVPAKAAFAQWHVVSLLLNMATLALVTAGMAFAAALPDRAPRVADEHSSL